MSLSHALSQHSITRTNNFLFPNQPRKCGYPQPTRVNPLCAGLYHRRKTLINVR